MCFGVGRGSGCALHGHGDGSVPGGKEGARCSLRVRVSPNSRDRPCEGSRAGLPGARRA